MTIVPVIDPRAVFVVHGRNLNARDAVFNFLRAIDLKPLEWDAIAAQVAGSPNIFEVLQHGFALAQAVIIILTPDEEVSLWRSLRVEERDARTRVQPRPNVLFEAGMAFMLDRKRTILLDFACRDLLSDLHGMLAIEVTSGGGAVLRQRLASRLSTAGCPVSTQGSNWLTSGDFEGALLRETASTLEILAPMDGANVGHKNIVRGLARPLGAPFQVLVSGRIGPGRREVWYPQQSPRREGLSWWASCYFGIATEPPGAQFKVVAVEGNPVTEGKVDRIPDSLQSNIVHVTRR